MRMPIQKRQSLADFRAATFAERFHPKVSYSLFYSTIKAHMRIHQKHFLPLFVSSLGVIEAVYFYDEPFGLNFWNIACFSDVFRSMCRPFLSELECQKCFFCDDEEKSMCGQRMRRIRKMQGLTSAVGICCVGIFFLCESH